MGGSPPKGEDIGSFVRSHENDTEQNQTSFDCFYSLNKLAEYTSDQEETENNKGAEQDGKGKGAEPEKVSSSGINVHTNTEERKQINEILRDSSNKILEFRLRGNRCYDEGNFVKAEELYTKGITCLQANERSYCLQALALCYSNRAAARMSLLKLRDAIEDCRSAMDSDHNFSKAQIRAGHCHLQLGELKNAMEFFEKYLATVNVDCLDKKVTLHAVEGQQNTQKVAQYIEQSMELLAQKSTDAVASALELISKALAIAPYSERLLRMKAESLIMLEKHAEAIVLCEQTFSFAENNFPSISLWRWHMLLKSNFYLGRVDVVRSILDQMKKTLEHRPARKDEELSSISSLANILQDILKLEIEGDKAIKSGKYTEAMKIFTGALSFCPESPHVVARFLCNRATALMALHEICKAIADCNVAIALDGEYCHALSIRATIHESIKDYQEAASDVRKLVCILEMRSSGSLGSSCSEELRDARKRMHRLEKEAKKGLTLDFYAILDVNEKASADDIKKSYHQAALIFHPDKAWNLLKILRNRGYKQQWNKISEDNKNGAEKIFKLLSQANSVLSDPVQRSEYDRKHNVKRARSSSKTRSRSSQF